MSSHILIVLDDVAERAILQPALQRCGYRTSTAKCHLEALEVLKSHGVDAVVTGLDVPGLNGLSLCATLRDHDLHLPVIICAAESAVAAIGALRSGARDFVTKAIAPSQLAGVLQGAMQSSVPQNGRGKASGHTNGSGLLETLIGESPPMRGLRRQIVHAADSEVPVLITGESGTGKELVARALHGLSRRAQRPFVAVNCSAIPDALLESELFGHVKGSFTDARTSRAGLFVQSDGGTLLLDEIGSMPLALQPKLLRALQEGRIRPVGGNREVAFDVRILSATNSDLETAVRENRFRADLFYRINVVRLAAPPLRSLGADVLLLAQHFLRQFAARTGKALQRIAPVEAERLAQYHWPGNVRELRNCIESCVAMADPDQLTVNEMPEQIRNGQPKPIAATDAAGMVSLDEIERRHIERVLVAARGNKTMAARILGFDRKTLYRKLRQAQPQ